MYMGRYLCKVLGTVVTFNKYEFSNKFSKNTEICNFIKKLSSESRVFACRRADRQTGQDR